MSDNDNAGAANPSAQLFRDKTNDYEARTAPPLSAAVDEETSLGSCRSTTAKPAHHVDDEIEAAIDDFGNESFQSGNAGNPGWNAAVYEKRRSLLALIAKKLAEAEAHGGHIDAKLAKLSATPPKPDLRALLNQAEVEWSGLGVQFEAGQMLLRAIVERIEGGTPKTPKAVK